jgi:hypothetical protein
VREAGLGAFLELLHELLRCAIDGAVLAEEWALPSDLFGFRLSVGDRDARDRPGLHDLVEVPPDGVAVVLEHVELVREVVDGAALKVPPEGLFTMSPCDGRHRNSPLTMYFYNRKGNHEGVGNTEQGRVSGNNGWCGADGLRSSESSEGRGSRDATSSESLSG